MTMARPVTLEEFDSAIATMPHFEPPAPAEPVDEQALEEARLAGYEAGYKAGWDDATSAAETEGDTARREAAQSLQALGFTFHEARTHLMEEIAPLLETLCGRILPDLARDTLGPVVREALEPLLRDTLDQPITLRVHPSARDAVQASLASEPSVEVALLEDPELSPGEVHITGSGEERMIDLDETIARLRSTIRTFFDTAAQPADGALAAPEFSAPPTQEMLRHG
ncbi:MAG: FliH/SctL family protein [Alkalilacustris sp.]